MKLIATCCVIATVLVVFVSGSAIPNENEEDTHKCPENQEWSDCASSCEPQCNNFKGDKCGLFMTLECRFQCVCKKGYLRVGENKCAPVDSEECGGEYKISPGDYFHGLNKTCPEGQHWVNCASDCDPQCKNYRGVKCGPFMTLRCNARCACKPGYLRIEGDDCAAEDSEECGGLHEPELPPLKSSAELKAEENE